MNKIGQKLDSTTIYQIYLDESRKYIVKYGTNNRDEYKNELANLIVELTKNSKYYNKMIKCTRRYMEFLKEVIKSTGKKVISVLINSRTRVLVDVSSPFGWLIDEIGLSWDKVLDTPKIPSTEIKGAVSAVFEWYDKKLRDYLFGSAHEYGSMKSLIDFSDAFLVGITKQNTVLERDVITPIYAPDPEKIMEHRAKPVPIQFLVISPDVKFEFLIIIDTSRLKRFWRSANKFCEKSAKSVLTEVFEKQAYCFIINLYKHLIEFIEDKSIDESSECEECKERVPDYNLLFKVMLKALKKAIKKAFEEWGIGSKTGSGYGLFDIVKYEPDNE